MVIFCMQIFYALEKVNLRGKTCMMSNLKKSIKSPNLYSIVETQKFDLSRSLETENLHAKLSYVDLSAYKFSAFYALEKVDFGGKTFIILNLKISIRGPHLSSNCQDQETQFLRIFES